LQKQLLSRPIFLAFIVGLKMGKRKVVIIVIQYKTKYLILEKNRM